MWNPYYQGAATGALGLLPKYGETLGNVAQNAIGNVTNPHLQMLYKGVALREFQFEFLFTPTSSQEAQQVDAIIKNFVFWSSPGVAQGTASSRHYLVPPYLFNIGFSFLGGNSLLNAVTSFFNNLGTEILGQQLSGAFGPSSSLSTTGNAKVYTIYHPCVLKDINVDYAPNGWSSFNDGYPVQTRLTLQFKETDIVTQQNINPTSTSSPFSAMNTGGLNGAINSSLSSAAPVASSSSISSIGPNADIGVALGTNVSSYVQGGL
jgi:hypothetical protein